MCQSDTWTNSTSAKGDPNVRETFCIIVPARLPSRSCFSSKTMLEYHGPSSNPFVLDVYCAICSALSIFDAVMYWNILKKQFSGYCFSWLNRFLLHFLGEAANSKSVKWLPRMDQRSAKKWHFPHDDVNSPHETKIPLRQRLTKYFFFFLAPFCRDKVSRSCFTGQLPGIRTVFILASLQMCKVQKVKSKHKVHWRIRVDGGGGGWGLRGLVGVVRGGHWGVGDRHRDCDGGLDLRKGGWLQMPWMLRGWGKLSIWRWGRR